jgi:hypothetical protein
MVQEVMSSTEREGDSIYRPHQHDGPDLKAEDDGAASGVECDRDNIRPAMNCHPKQTRAKAGIVQPNRIYTDEDFEYSGLCLLSVEETGFVEEALDDPSWKKEMQEEINSILENHTWELSSLPLGHRAIGLKVGI